MGDANDRQELILDDPEVSDWLESMDEVLERAGSERVALLLRQLQTHAYEKGVRMPFSANTPQINSIPVCRPGWMNEISQLNFIGYQGLLSRN